MLGVYYCEEGNVQRDFKKGVYWHTKAAEQGHANAQLQLGICYGTGEGVPKDYEKAKYWVTKSAEQGYEEAKKLLATLD